MQNGAVERKGGTGENAPSGAESLEHALVALLTPLTERLGLVMEGLERWLERRSTGGSRTGLAGGEGFVPDLAPGMLTGELLLEGSARPEAEESLSRDRASPT